MLPTNRNRLAITLWFIDAQERAAREEKEKEKEMETGDKLEREREHQLQVQLRQCQNMQLEVQQQQKVMNGSEDSLLPLHLCDDSHAIAAAIQSRAVAAAPDTIVLESVQIPDHSMYEHDNANVATSNAAPMQPFLIAESELSVPTNDAGADTGSTHCSSNSSTKYSKEFKVQFHSHEQFAQALVDVVDHTAVLVSANDNSFDPVRIHVLLNTNINKIHDPRTIAKYIRKKKILSVTVFYSVI